MGRGRIEGQREGERVRVREGATEREGRDRDEWATGWGESHSWCAAQQGVSTTQGSSLCEVGKQVATTLLNFAPDMELL